MVEEVAVVVLLLPEGYGDTARERASLLPGRGALNNEVRIWLAAEGSSLPPRNQDFKVSVVSIFAEAREREHVLANSRHHSLFGVGEKLCFVLMVGDGSKM
jgi:hypothetical protein